MNELDLTLRLKSNAMDELNLSALVVSELDVFFSRKLKS